MTEGLALDALRRRFGNERVRDMLARADRLAEMGLLDLRDGRIRLTREGEALHGEVCVGLA
jgi:coproporphyrinogen III oxidase-like Fe-S oxidoreductase